MLVNELKKEIEKYDKKDLVKIIVELYKRIPKYKKEEYSIDDFIKNVTEGKKKTVKKELSFDELRNEISYFLTCVDNEYYVVPNNVISKKERSGWRFKVKKYYKELNKILPDQPNGNKATFFLIEIFKRLSIGSNVLLFINWETFKALGVSQGEYYDVLVKRILYKGYTTSNLKECIDLLQIAKDPYELSYDMYNVFVDNLKQSSEIEMAITLLKEKIDEFKHIETKNNMKQYEIEKNINDNVICILELYSMLGEINQGIKYFHTNYICKFKEVKEYVLLEKLKRMDFIEEWVREYESMMDKINFRDSLRDDYAKFKKIL